MFVGGFGSTRLGVNQAKIEILEIPLNKGLIFIKASMWKDYVFG